MSSSLSRRDNRLIEWTSTGGHCFRHYSNQSTQLVSTHRRR